MRSGLCGLGCAVCAVQSVRLGTSLRGRALGLRRGGGPGLPGGRLRGSRPGLSRPQAEVPLHGGQPGVHRAQPVEDLRYLGGRAHGTHPGLRAGQTGRRLPRAAGLSLTDLTEILSKLVYHEHPIGQPLVDQIRIAAEDLKLVKVLESTTDPKAFADRVTVNLLG